MHGVLRLKVSNLRGSLQVYPKINTGGDVYPMSYALEIDVFMTKSETRTLLGFKK
jgi:hypothetical protein